MKKALDIIIAVLFVLLLVFCLIDIKGIKEQNEILKAENQSMVNAVAHLSDNLGGAIVSQQSSFEQMKEQIIEAQGKTGPNPLLPIIDQWGQAIMDNLEAMRPLETKINQLEAVQKNLNRLEIADTTGIQKNMDTWGRTLKKAIQEPKYHKVGSTTLNGGDQ